jgi:NAD(P)-dependent dehydrogenase (short-subunit alcohol dehydrogenase family)
VTGASRGIGRTIAEGLANAGATVVVLARKSDRLDATAASLPADAMAVPVDVTDPTSVRGAFTEIENNFGHLDLLVNNAAVAWPHRVEEVSDEELLAEVATNLVGPILAIRSAVPLLRRAEAPHIVNISTESVAEPFPYLVVYAATKGGLEVLSRGLVHELADDGIRVTLIRVGRTEGGEFREHWHRERREVAEATWSKLGFRPRDAVGQPAESVAEAVVFAVTRPARSIADVIHLRAQE